MITPGQNTGFIASEPSPTDWIKRGYTGAANVATNPSEDWRSYESPGEWQRDMRTLFETEACVSFSANDCLQTYGNYCIKNGLWNPDTVKWLTDNGYIGTDGLLHFSDRFTAKMSGTTENGNTLQAVWDSIKHNGLVPESAWPSDFSDLPQDGETEANWEFYYSAIPANVIALGQSFAAKIKVAYQWIAYNGTPATAALLEADLQVAPIQIATAVCPPWNTDQPIQGCGNGAAHATQLSWVGEDGYHILDHYVPFDKILAPDYDITYAMQGTLTPVLIADNPIVIANLKQQISILQKIVNLLENWLSTQGSKTSSNGSPDALY